VKQRNLRMLQRAQIMINIKSAKAYRTTSFEASSEYECDLPLPNNVEPTERSPKCTKEGENYQHTEEKVCFHS